MNFIIFLLQFVGAVAAIFVFVVILVMSPELYQAFTWWRPNYLLIYKGDKKPILKIEEIRQDTYRLTVLNRSGNGINASYNKFTKTLSKEELAKNMIKRSKVFNARRRNQKKLFKELTSEFSHLNNLTKCWKNK